MKILTKTTIKDLAGKDLMIDDKVFTVGDAVSHILLLAPAGGKLKMFNLAQKFYSDEEVSLDDADTALVKNSVETTEQYSNLVCGQLLVMLAKASE